MYYSKRPVNAQIILIDWMYITKFSSSQRKIFVFFSITISWFCRKELSSLGALLNARMAYIEQEDYGIPAWVDVIKLQDLVAQKQSVARSEADQIGDEDDWDVDDND
ncbi:hypothetical protein DFH05DRAFT_1461409 [Lentinula detonsa]|uniref:Uncharacterized protein n=1 Tax=Lentinula detonsa TaxID=2804962 RepID=A0A9W8NYH6_9AGAR|nr:hypothetical protein DFH05DRAFT_1461409 [Lentinula detonsa]